VVRLFLSLDDTVFMSIFAGLFNSQFEWSVSAFTREDEADGSICYIDAWNEV
jgi:hypothetical protein